MSELLEKKELESLNQLIAEIYKVAEPQEAFQFFLEGLKDIMSFQKGNIYFYKNDKENNIVFDEFIYYSLMLAQWSCRAA